MKYPEFVPHEKLDSVLGIRVSAYREMVERGTDTNGRPSTQRHFPRPVYGILERNDDFYILRRDDRSFVKLEKDEGVFLI